MTDASTNKLLDTLIVNVSTLTNSVNELVNVESVRSERDKHQEAENAAVNEFIKKSQPIIDRSRESQAMWDKVKPVIMVFLIIGFLTMAGVNFSK